MIVVEPQTRTAARSGSAWVSVRRPRLSALLLFVAALAPGLAGCSWQNDLCRSNDALCNPAASGLVHILKSEAQSPLFVAAGTFFPSACFAYYSYNGTSGWFGPVTIAPCTSLVGLRYINGLFFALGQDSAATNCVIFTSPDARTWTQRTCPTSANSTLYDIAYGGGVYIGVGDGDGTGTPFFISSNDGLNWSQFAPAGGPANYASVALHKNGRFYFGEEASSSPVSVYAGSDPVAGGLSALAGSNTGSNARYYDLTSGPDSQVMAVTSQTLSYFAADGSNFTSGSTFTTVPTTERPRGVVYAEGRYVSVGGEIGGSERCWVENSGDGLNWTAAGEMNAACPAQTLPTDIVFAFDRFLAGGYSNADTNGYMFHSDTGAPGTWTLVNLGALYLVNGVAIGVDDGDR